MRKSLWFFLSSILLFLTGCLGQGQGNDLTGPFAPILGIVDIILIKLPANMDSNKALVHFIIWLLVFAVVYTGVDKVFNKDGKRKGTSILISVILSIMGTIAIPNAFIQEIFRLYSSIFTWVLVLVPGLVGIYIAQTKFKGDNFASKGARVVIIAMLTYAYFVLLNNVAASAGVGLYELDISTVLTYGMGILSLLLLYYFVILFAGIGSWGKGSGGGGGFKGAKNAFDGMEDKFETEKKRRKELEEEMSTADKIESDLDHIKSKLEGFTASGWEDIAKLEKDVNALSAVVTKYGAQLMTNPKIQEYIHTVLKDLEKNKTVLDDVLNKMSVGVKRFEAEFTALDTINKKMLSSAGFKNLMTPGGDEKRKADTVKVITELSENLKKVGEVIASLGAEIVSLKSSESNLVKVINVAFGKLKDGDVEGAKASLSAAANSVSKLNELFKQVKNYESLEEKYLNQVKSKSRQVQGDIISLFNANKK